MSLVEGRGTEAGRSHPRSESRSSSPVLKGLALTDFARGVAESAVGEHPATAAAAAAEATREKKYARGRRRSSVAAKDLLLKAADLTSGDRGASGEGVMDGIGPEKSLANKAGWALKREDKGKAGTSRAEEIARAKEENAAREREEQRARRERLARESVELLAKKLADRREAEAEKASNGARQSVCEKKRDEVAQIKKEMKEKEEEQRRAMEEEEKEKKALQENIRKQRRRSIVAVEHVRQCKEAEAKALRDEGAFEAQRLRAAEEERVQRQLADDDGTVAEVTATRGTFSTLSPELVLSQSSNSDHEADGGADPVLNREHHVREVGSQLCKKSEGPEYQFAIGSQPFSCPSDSQDSVHTLHLRLDVKETRSPVLFGLATGNLMTSIHHRLHGPLQHLITKDMVLMSLKRPWTSLSAGIAIEIDPCGPHMLPSGGPYVALPFIKESTNPNTRAYVKLCIDTAMGSASFSLAYAPSGTLPSDIHDSAWVQFGGHFTGIQGSVFPIVGLLGKGDSCYFYPESTLSDLSAQPTDRSEQPGNPGTWQHNMANSKATFPTRERRRSSVAQGARKGFGGIKARNFDASAWANMQLPDREEGWYHEREVMRAVESIQRWGRMWTAVRHVKAVKADKACARIATVNWRAKLRGKGLEITGYDPCDYIAWVVERRVAEAEEEKREKMRVKALKTAQRVQINTAETRLKQDEKVLCDRDKELIHKFVEKFATKDSFDKFCKLGAGEYRRSGMGSRASTMDLKEFLAYLNHLHLVPSRLTKSTAVGIFTAVNKGTKNGGASKHVEKAVVEIEKDVHDDDAHELSFDEFFECMRRVAIRLAVTDCDEETYDGMNAQLGDHKPVYFCTVDSVDYAQAVPAYNFDAVSRTWIKSSPTVNSPDKKPFVSPTLSPQDLGFTVNQMSPSLSPMVSYSKSFDSPTATMPSPLSRRRSSTGVPGMSPALAPARSPPLKGTWNRSIASGHSSTPPLRISKDVEAARMHKIYSRSFEVDQTNGSEPSMEKRLHERLMTRRMSDSQSPMLMPRPANERVTQLSSFEADDSFQRTSSLDGNGEHGDGGKSSKHTVNHHTSGSVSTPHSPAVAPRKAGRNHGQNLSPSKSGVSRTSPMMPRLPSIQVSRVGSNMSSGSGGSPIMAPMHHRRASSQEHDPLDNFRQVHLQGQSGSRDSSLHGHTGFKHKFDPATSRTISSHLQPELDGESREKEKHEDECMFHLPRRPPYSTQG